MVRFVTPFVFTLCAFGQQPSFTLDQVLGAPFPTSLTAAPDAGMVAWVSNARGVRNIMVAGPTSYQAYRLTTYTEDDGQEISDLAWAPDAGAIAYVRGGDPNGAGENPNPALNPTGEKQSVWLLRVCGAAPCSAPAGPHKIGDGASPVISPRGDRVAFAQGGKIWSAPLDGSASAAPLFVTRGYCSRPLWSPDGARIAFESSRGDHGFIGVYELAARTLRYLDPSTDNDSQAEWSPDSRSVAFIRIPSSGLREVRRARRTGEPWSIRVASAETGEGRQIWRAHEGPGSVFRGITARNQLLWADGARIVFPWESDGWTHLYSVPATGGDATLLTPGAFEVEDAALAAGRREVIFSSNQDDIDRRHLWKAPVGGGTPAAVTTGSGIETHPAAISDGRATAFIRSDAQLPARAAILAGGNIHDMDAGAIPADFPARQMVAPQQVLFSSADGLSLHGQLFLPPGLAVGARAPAVVFFHGGSRRQMLLGWHHMGYYSNAYALDEYLVNSGFAVLSVNYRSGIGYGLDFREALNYGPSGGSEYNDVQGAGVYLRSRPDIDPARIGCWGGSYGGYLTAMALARASDLYKAGVDFHGVHNWATELEIPETAPDYKLAFESSPLAFIDTWRSPVLLIQGDDDREVHFNQTVIMEDALRRHKVDVSEIVYPDEGHEFLLYRTWRAAYAATAQFLSAHLK